MLQITYHPKNTLRLTGKFAIKSTHIEVSDPYGSHIHYFGENERYDT